MSPSINSNRKRNRSSGRIISFDTPNNNESHLPIVGNQVRCALCSTNKEQFHSVAESWYLKG
jgi:hypothetical protein